MEYAIRLCGPTVANLGRATVIDASDSGVVKRILGGDRDVFRLLVERYERQVFTLCLRMVKNRHDAEDCAQTAFIKAYSALGQFRSGSSFKSWIYRIASNVCIDALRKSARIPATVMHDENEIQTHLAESGPGPRACASMSELRDALETALQSLDDAYRLPLVFFHLEGLEISEISAILKLRLGTVKTRVRRGRLMLREIILRDWPELASRETLSS